MDYIGYHGTNGKIEVWDLSHLGKSQGQTLFPGIYFTDSYEKAKEYADLAVEKFGGTPIVYIAECQLDKPLDARKGLKIFHNFNEVIDFCKEYFPDWFDTDGDLLSYKIGYVREKFETYQGQYNLIKYAANENKLDLIEVMGSLGYDSCIDYGEFVITSPQQILSFEEADHTYTWKEVDKISLPAEESIVEGNPYKAAFETKAMEYSNAARRGANYKTMPGNRFLRRVRIQQNGGNNVWFDLDMNRLFKKGSFAVKIPVIGETDQYIVTFSFEDWLPYLKNAITNTGFNQMTIKRSLSEMMRFHDLKIDCTCSDYRYRLKYHNSVKGNQEGEPELRPSDETNPTDNLGPMCKHLSFANSNKSVFFDKVSRIIYNYFINLQRTQPMLFDRVIAPKLGLDKKEEVQEQPQQIQEQTHQPEVKEEPKEQQPVEQQRNNQEGEQIQPEETEQDNSEETV